MEALIRQPTVCQRPGVDRAQIIESEMFGGHQIHFGSLDLKQWEPVIRWFAALSRQFSRYAPINSGFVGKLGLLVNIAKRGLMTINTTRSLFIGDFESVKGSWTEN